MAILLSYMAYLRADLITRPSSEREANAPKLVVCVKYCVCFYLFIFFSGVIFRVRVYSKHWPAVRKKKTS